MEMMEIVSFSSLPLPLRCSRGAELHLCRLAEAIAMKSSCLWRSRATQSCLHPLTRTPQMLCSLGMGTGDPRWQFPAGISSALSWLAFTQPLFHGGARHVSPGIRIGTARGFHGTCFHQGQEAVSLPLTQTFPSCVLGELLSDQEIP